MSTREKLLDTYETILIADGERAATLDAIAAGAGVSKGGLLYHFPSKDALVVGLLDRLRAAAAVDLELMGQAPEGPSAYYVRTSATTDTPVDRSIVAVTRLGMEHHGDARAALDEIQAAWLELIAREAGDVATARAILLIGDGLYYNTAFAGQAGDGIDELLAVVARLLGR